MAGVVLRGAPNFRDLGGLATADGRRLRPASLLRSGHLGELHAEDIAWLAQHLGRDLAVVDLRSEAECALRPPCPLPGATLHALPIQPTVARKLDALLAAGEAAGPAQAHRFMREAYENFVDQARPQLARLFALVAARAGRPLIVHCAHGKDRTGFVVAMLLAALEVPRAAIFEDYLLTNARVTPQHSGRYPADTLAVLHRVHADYLQAAFAAIDSAFGGVVAYLEQAAALTPARRAALRQALTL